MRPTDQDAILDFVARVNENHGGCMVQHTKKFIEGMGYEDPGRELRRLKDKGLLKSWKIGVYWHPKTAKAQGLGRWG